VEYPPGDVRRYGADLTGATDSASAINNAIAVADAETNGGGIVHLPTGTYAVGSQIVLPHQVAIEGDGCRNTIIQAISGTFPTDTAVVKLGTTGLVFGTYLKRLKIDCNDIDGSIGVYSDKVSEHGGLFEVFIADYKSKGVYFYNTGTLPPQNFRLVDLECFSNSTELSITGITRSGSTATATTAAAHGLSSGKVVAIDDAGEAEYNGAFTVTGTPATNTFTFEVVGTPTTPATGTIVYSTTVGVHLELDGATWRGIDNISVTSRGLVEFAGIAVLIEGSGGAIQGAHIETMTAGIVLGANSPSSGITLYNIDGGPNMNDIVTILGGQNLTILGVKRQTTGTLNTIRDVTNEITLTDNQVGLYALGDGTAGGNLPIISTSNELTDNKLRGNMDLRDDSAYKIDGNTYVSSNMVRTPTETTTNLNDISHAINTSAEKVEGACVFDSTAHIPMYATGSADGSTWVGEKGGATITLTPS
jgi:hypothetical protein